MGVLREVPPTPPTEGSVLGLRSPSVWLEAALMGPGTGGACGSQ